MIEKHRSDVALEARRFSASERGCQKKAAKNDADEHAALRSTSVLAYAVSLV
jgi:hypothetical protein